MQKILWGFIKFNDSHDFYGINKMLRDLFPKIVDAFSGFSILL